MKKLSKLIVKDQVEILKEGEMKLLLGGGCYHCCCGGDEGTVYECEDIDANAIVYAVNKKMNSCYSTFGGFATCFRF